MSILLLPAEILLEIFDCHELSPLDLKSLRLSHSTFRTLASTRLFRALSLSFTSPYYKSSDTPSTTTITQRLHTLLSDSTTTTTTTKLDFRELHVYFSHAERNGFVTFTERSSKKLLALLGDLSVLKIDCSLLANRSGAVHRCLRKFFGNFRGRLERGWMIHELEYRGGNAHFVHFAGITGLKRLKLAIKLEGRNREEALFNTAKSVGGVIESSSGSLEAVCLDGPREGAGGGRSFLGSVLRAVSVPLLGITSLETTEAVGAGVPWGKLGKLKSFSAPPAATPWGGMREAGVKLAKIRRAAALSEALCEYIASAGSGVKEAYIALTNSETEHVRTRFLSESLPALHNALTTFTLVLPARSLSDNGNGKWELTSHLVPSFDALMRILQGFVALREVVVELDLAVNQPEQNWSWSLLDLPEGWSSPYREGWKNRLKMVVRRYRRGYLSPETAPRVGYHHMYMYYHVGIVRMVKRWRLEVEEDGRECRFVEVGKGEVEGMRGLTEDRPAEEGYFT